MARDNLTYFDNLVIIKYKNVLFIPSQSDVKDPISEELIKHNVYYNIITYNNVFSV